MYSFKAVQRLLVYLAGWDPLGWVHDMDWYRRMLGADWFRPIRPYWLRYRLDWVSAIVIILVLILIIWLVSSGTRRRSRRREEGRKTSPLKIARQFEEQGETRLAAESYLQAGKPEKAFELFEESECWHEAAEVAERLGWAGKAVELYERSNDEISILRVLKESGDLERAMEYHRRRGTLAEAAQMFLEAGEAHQAADVFVEAGQYARAAEVLFEAGENLAAADNLLKHLSKASSQFTESEAGLLGKGAETLEKAGRQGEAANLYRAAGKYARAGELYFSDGKKKEAASCFEKAGQLEKAASLFRESGSRNDWIRLLELMRREGRHFEDSEWVQALSEAGLHERAARHYRQRGNLEKAAAEYLEAGQMAEAALVMAELGKHARAAELFMQTGDPAAARDQALAAGDLKLAARAAMNARMFYEAGCDFFALGDMARAVDAFQNVSSGHPEYRTASSLLGQAFGRLGDRDMALKMHRRATEGLQIGRDNLDLFYHLARRLEDSADDTSTAEALGIYDEILSVKYTFRDSKSRRDRLRQNVRR